MLKVLLGSKDKELVLQYILSKNEGNASKIARFFNLTPSQINSSTLWKSALEAYPDELRDALKFNRTTPRRKNKSYVLKVKDENVATEL